METALHVKETIEKSGKTAVLLAVNEVTPETLLEFPSIDAYVNIACPRISLEAPAKFSKPVLTVNEFLVAVGEVSWENLLKRGLFEN
jgi:2-(3-amino-3-carboxypropyl)histidine synthase